MCEHLYLFSLVTERQTLRFETIRQNTSTFNQLYKMPIGQKVIRRFVVQLNVRRIGMNVIRRIYLVFDMWSAQFVCNMASIYEPDQRNVCWTKIFRPSVGARTGTIFSSSTNCQFGDVLCHRLIGAWYYTSNIYLKKETPFGYNN